MKAVAPAPVATVGWLGFAAGAAALLLTLVVFWAGPFAPQQRAGVSLGEVAADIAKSAARSVAGRPQPEPEARTTTIDDHLAVGAGVLAGLAIVMGVASLVRRESKRAALSGIALGGLAIGVQLFAWTIMIVVGGMVIVAIIYALRDSLADIFDGLSGG
jgi:hypothetical protein